MALIYDSLSGCDKQYFKSAFDTLSEIYDFKNSSLDIRIVSYDDDPSSLKIDKPTALIVCSDENHGSSDHFYFNKNVKAILKPYPHLSNYAEGKNLKDSRGRDILITRKILLNEETVRYVIECIEEDERTGYIPLGSCNGYNVSELKSPADRSIDIFFGGQASGRRIDVLKDVHESIHDLDLNVLLYFYEGFGPGTAQGTHEYLKILEDASIEKIRETPTIESYANFMKDSKISLCPQGHSSLTYRMTEAAMSGCIIFSMPLPNIDLYNSAPIIVVPDWSDKHLVSSIVQSVIDDNDFMIDMQQQTLDWYNKKLSPHACANKIFSHIKGLGLL